MNTVGTDACRPSVWRRIKAFTLIELLVVMAIIATLLTVAVPRYFKSMDNSRETVLRHDLKTMREAVDKYQADTGKYPESLQDLVEKRYLRAIPPDPMTDSNKTWVPVMSDNADRPGLRDVKSGAPGKASDGTAYAEW